MCSFLTKSYERYLSIWAIDSSHSLFKLPRCYTANYFNSSLCIVMSYSSTDSRLLLNGLKNYQSSLERHIAQVTAEYQQVNGRWHAFSQVSEGDYADQFRSGWLRTKAQFEAYIAQSQSIKALLSERIVALEALNRTEGGL